MTVAVFVAFPKWQGSYSFMTRGIQNQQHIMQRNLGQDHENLVHVQYKCAKYMINDMRKVSMVTQEIFVCKPVSRPLTIRYRCE